jgi:hypothetical protein
MLMETLIQKVERMAATILEAMDIEQGSSEIVAPAQDDERARDFELHRDAHHTLIEPCW